MKWLIIFILLLLTELDAFFHFVLCFSSRILFRTLNHQYDYIYDWTMLKQKTHQSQPNPAILLGQAEPRNERDKEKEKQSGKTLLSD